MNKKTDKLNPNWISFMINDFFPDINSIASITCEAFLMSLPLEWLLNLHMFVE